MPVTNRDKIQPGDQFARVYKGKLYTCTAKVIGNGIGFETWDGSQFKTLSTAGKHAVQIPGYEINGFVWWNRKEDMPVQPGPKPGSHRTPQVESIGPVAPVAGVAAVAAVDGVGNGKPARNRRILPIVAAMAEAKAATPAPPRMLKNIKLSAEQSKVPKGQIRFFCTACNSNFTSVEQAPAQCPHGHPAKLPANLIEQAAKAALS